MLATLHYYPFQPLLFSFHTLTCSQQWTEERSPWVPCSWILRYSNGYIVPRVVCILTQWHWEWSRCQSLLLFNWHCLLQYLCELAVLHQWERRLYIGNRQFTGIGCCLKACFSSTSQSTMNLKHTMGEYGHLIQCTRWILLNFAHNPWITNDQCHDAFREGGGVYSV